MYELCRSFVHSPDNRPWIWSPCRRIKIKEKKRNFSHKSLKIPIASRLVTLAILLGTGCRSSLINGWFNDDTPSIGFYTSREPDRQQGSRKPTSPRFEAAKKRNSSSRRRWIRDAQSEKSRLVQERAQDANWTATQQRRCIETREGGGKRRPKRTGRADTSPLVRGGCLCAGAGGRVGDWERAAVGSPLSSRLFRDVAVLSHVAAWGCSGKISRYRYFLLHKRLPRGARSFPSVRGKICDCHLRWRQAYDRLAALAEHGPLPWVRSPPPAGGRANLPFLTIINIIHK